MLYNFTEETSRNVIKSIMKLHFRKFRNGIFRICDKWDIQIINLDGTFYEYQISKASEYFEYDSHIYIGKSYEALVDYIEYMIDITIGGM